MDEGARPPPNDSRFVFLPKPAQGFTAIYEKAPAANFASTNAGDLKLYVGGGAINLAFEKALQKAGQDTSKYEAIHQKLLVLAAATPGQCVLLEGSDLGALGDDVLAACARVPEGGVDLERPEGFAAVTLFREGKRPEHERNVGMCYVVGPLGATQRCGSEESMPKEEFLRRAERAAEGALLAASELNRRPGAWPKVDLLRMCLVSGGVYLHPKASKTEVAEALLKGLLRAHDSGPHAPRVELAYAEDVFAQAFHRLADSGSVLPPPSVSRL